MDNQDTTKDAQKPRRPLPVPGAPPAQRPNTPVLSQQAPISISPASFYADPRSKAPLLPERPPGAGSSTTSYIPPSESPPSYRSDFREPELVKDETIDKEVDDISDVPPLTSDNSISSNVTWWGNQNGNTPYEAGWNTDPKVTWDNKNWELGANWEDAWKTNSDKVFVPIDGRDTDEENMWWDPYFQPSFARPGSGLLPPVLADQLHEPEHSIFSVTASNPDIRPKTPPAPTTETSTGSLNASTSGERPKAPPPPPPTAQDVRTAVPHPNAYYCPKENGWVILSWKSSSVVPPLSRTFLTSSHYPLPDQTRRRRTSNCIADEENVLCGPSNKTHHFHKYSKAVDALKLTPPYRVNEWELTETKQKRRAGTILSDDLNLETIKAKAEEEDRMEMEEGKPEDEGMLLDLYMCCQCSFYCVASGTLPGVIPTDMWNEFLSFRINNPVAGKSKEFGPVIALETLLTAIQNHLWKGESRSLKLNGPGFMKRMGWNKNVEQVFEALGFWCENVGTDALLRAPVIDTTSSQGKQNRAKLLRAWVEISAWLVDWKRIHASVLREVTENYKPLELWIKIDSAREMYQTAIGAHPDQIPRGDLTDTVLEPMRTIEECFLNLGLTPMSYSSELLAFGYYAQCRCDPARTMEYFSSFSTIIKLMGLLDSCPPQLHELMITEESRQRFTLEDLKKSTELLGFGANGPLRLDYDGDIPDNFIENAWRECIKRAWADPDQGAALQKDANDALRRIAEARGSTELRRVWEMNKSNFMTPSRAYDVLEVPKDVDDAMLITVYQMRLDEQPLQTEKMREALSIIAEVRNSERLREFARTSRDPGDIVAPTRADWPRGLNQLGNTCYLNSLLQYFYTIKDLREAVIPMAQMNLKAIEDEKLSEDDLKKHRVGGRLVTRREILRSKRFVSQLADLFHKLEYDGNASVTPSIELAKLALVTSKDEEDEEADNQVDKGGTDSSNDTDATLVEDGPSRFSVEPHPSSPLSPARSSSSVLGKRPRDLTRQDTEMDVDASGSGSSPPSSTSVSRGSSKVADTSTSGSVTAGGDGDVVMQETSPAKRTPPPLPPRNRTVNNDSVMMFGKQHDVAECMDNCMFQIEIALLKFDALNDSSSDDSDKISIIKRLFYGTLRQRFVETVKGRPNTHVKEDLFSHLPVNVAEDGFDIYEGLGRYFDDTIEYEGQKVPIEVSLVKLPPLLQVQLQRVQFNRELLQSWKSQAYVKFEETIYMDRFMDTADPEKRKRSKLIQEELNTCRERVRLLNQSNDLPVGTALENTHKFLSREGSSLVTLGIPLDFDQVEYLAQEQTFVKEEIEELRSRITRLKIELEDIWKDEKNVPYELTSVFIHRGTSPSWGHYFFYSRNLPEKPDEWFKYNDSEVTEIRKEEVLADTTGSTANPYLLVFARKGSEVVDTVNRFDPAVLDVEDHDIPP